jgi:hypothetical protein
MTVSYGASGAIAYSASGGTTVAPAYPTGITADQKLILIVIWKPSVSTSANGPSTPSGWTPIRVVVPDISLELTGGYSAIPGADTGNMGWAAYEKTAVGSETGTQTVTLTGNNIAAARIVRLTKSGTAWDTTDSDDGWVTTTPPATTSVIVGIRGGIGFDDGDHVLYGMAIPTDVTTPAQFTATNISSGIVTFGTMTEIGEFDTGTGNDMGGFLAENRVVTGTNEVTNPTVAMTIAGTRTNVRGPVFVIRTRDITAPPVAVTDYWGSAA